MSKPISPELPLIVIYHGGGCRDGFCAAWVLHTVFPNAEFLPANYGDPVPNVTGKQVIIVDFSYDTMTLRNMQNDCIGDLVILDHHKSAEPKILEFQRMCQEESLGDPYTVFTNERSGAMLAAVYVQSSYYGKWVDRFGRWFPKLIEYVQDRDLWIYRSAHSREVNEVIRLRPMTFPDWDDLYLMLETQLDVAVSLGSAILASVEEIVNSHVKHSTMVRLAEYDVPCVNCTTKISEVGNKLCAGHPFAVMYFDRGDGTRVFSLRSDEGGVDVSKVAQLFDGGGHRSAAGFTMKLPSNGLLPVSA